MQLKLFYTFANGRPVRNQVGGARLLLGYKDGFGVGATEMKYVTDYQFKLFVGPTSFKLPCKTNFLYSIGLPIANWQSTI